MSEIKTPIRLLADLWKEGSPAFLAELKEHGFDPVPNDVFARAPENFLKSPLRARALSSKSRVGAFEASSSFTYIGKDANPRELESAQDTWAILFADKSFEKSEKKIFKSNPTLFVKNPDGAVDFILQKIFPRAWAGLSQHKNQEFEGVLLESGALVGPDAKIGRGTIIETGARIGARVVIGERCRIGAYTRIADDCVLGNEVQVASHASIGGQGFGFVKYPKIPAPVPRLHVGRAVIGNNVRIGSHVAIDRGVFEDTVIGSFSALDNHVQIAHNCVVGNHNVYCAFVGLSGSTKVGDRVTFGAMAGTKGHLEIGSDVIVAGQTGVTADLPTKSVVKGYPPRPLQEALKLQVLIGKLPELFSRLKKIEKDIQK